MEYLLKDSNRGGMRKWFLLSEYLWYERSSRYAFLKSFACISTILSLWRSLADIRSPVVVSPNTHSLFWTDAYALAHRSMYIRWLKISTCSLLFFLQRVFLFILFVFQYVKQELQRKTMQCGGLCGRRVTVDQKSGMHEKFHASLFEAAKLACTDSSAEFSDDQDDKCPKFCWQWF